MRSQKLRCGVIDVRNRHLLMFRFHAQIELVILLDRLVG